MKMLYLVLLVLDWNFSSMNEKKRRITPFERLAERPDWCANIAGSNGDLTALLKNTTLALFKNGIMFGNGPVATELQELKWATWSVLGCRTSFFLKIELVDAHKKNPTYLDSAHIRVSMYQFLAPGHKVLTRNRDSRQKYWHIRLIPTCSWPRFSHGFFQAAGISGLRKHVISRLYE